MPLQAPWMAQYANRVTICQRKSEGSALLGPPPRNSAMTCWIFSWVAPTTPLVTFGLYAATNPTPEHDGVND